MLQTLRFIWNHPLASQERIGSYARWLRWQIGSRVLGLPVICDWVGNTKLIVESGMTGATGNLYCGLHEFSDMSLVLHLLRAEDGFADIGANIGSYSVLAAGVIGAKVKAFEPHPTTFAKLTRNLKINEIETLVDSVQSAVGSGSGSLSFTADLDTMNQVVEDNYQGAVIEVPVASLDQLLCDFETLLWKIDVEGFETEVIEGAREQLKKMGLKAILLETESPRLIELLRADGFDRVVYDPVGRCFLDAGAKKATNALWIRDRPFCEDRVKNAPKVRVFGIEV